MFTTGTLGGYSPDIIPVLDGRVHYIVAYPHHYHPHTLHTQVAAPALMAPALNPPRHIKTSAIFASLMTVALAASASHHQPGSSAYEAIAPPCSWYVGVIVFLGVAH